MNELQKFALEHKPMFWDVSRETLSNMSDQAIIERFMTFGTWEDFFTLQRIIGKNKIQNIFLIRSRIPLLDILRGISLIGMIVFHAHYMFVHIFGGEFGSIPEGAWRLLGFVVALMFIMLSGYVNALGYRDRSLREIYPRSLRRDLLFGLVALGISVVTYVCVPEQRISWGIIHFFTLVTLVQPFFSRMGVWIFLLAIVSFSIGNTLTEITGDTYFLVPLGLVPGEYFSADYYPLFPWIGYIFLGQGMAYLSSRFGLVDILAGLSFPRLALLRILGCHSLLVYVLHTPILYAIFYEV